MKRHISRQQETWGVVALALLVVLLYAAWGSSVLHSREQAQSGAGAELVVRN